jgi:4-amino-4-deoxy-L-arabinose transferase-like glycosyltransferase
MQAGVNEVGGSGRGRIVALAALAALIAAFGALRLPPLDRDEARFAQATAQMLESGDFLRIRYLDEERNKKPAGSYWAQALSVGVFSDAAARDIAFYRAPSIVALFLAVIAAGALAARVFSPVAGVMAAALSAATPAALIEGLIAKADAMLLAATSIAMALLFMIGAAAPGAPRQRLSATLFWLAVGAGVMIKGPVIALFVAPPLIAMIATQKRGDWGRRLAPATGALILVLMIGPWLLAIQSATDGRFLQASLGGDMLAKIGAGRESHGAPPLTYAALSPALFLPMIALAPAALVHAWRMRADWRFAALLAAIAAPWAMFEIAATKLPHYLLPLAPALAALCAATIAAPNLCVLRRTGAGLAVLGAGALAIAPVVISRTFDVGVGLAGGLTIAAALALALFGAAQHWRGAALRGTILLCAASMAFVLAALVIAPRLQPLWIAPRLAADLKTHAPAAAPVALVGYAEPAAIFLIGAGARLTDAASAARMRERGSAAIVAADALVAFRAASPADCPAQEKTRIDGYNYSKGRPVSLYLFAPCEGVAQ